MLVCIIPSGSIDLGALGLFEAAVDGKWPIRMTLLLIGAIDSQAKTKKWWQYNAPVGHVLPLSKRPRDFAAMMCSSLSSNPVYLGVVVARCVIDGDAIKV